MRFTLEARVGPDLRRAAADAAVLDRFDIFRGETGRLVLGGVLGSISYPAEY